MIGPQNITLYGAVTKPPRSVPRFKTRQSVRQSLERLLFRVHALPAIDHRNYVTAGSYNLGDHAIALAVHQQIKSLALDSHITSINWNEIEKASVEAPLIVAGSGYFFIESTKKPAQRLHHAAQCIRQKGLACSYYGVGVNYVGEDTRLVLSDISPENQEMIAQSLAVARTISVRDAKSQEILQPLTAIPIAVTGDPALFIKSDRPLIRKSGESSKPLTIGINIPFHGPAASARASKDLRAYIDFFKSLQASTGCRFIQTIHFHSEIVLGKIMQDHGVRLTPVVGDVQTLLNAYQQMDFHIGGMLHSCILSASTGTPCIGLAYDIKHQGFFDLLGQPDLCIPAQPFDPDRLSAACQSLMGRLKATREQITARRDALEIQSRHFLEHTLQALLL